MVNFSSVDAFVSHILQNNILFPIAKISLPNSLIDSISTILFSVYLIYIEQTCERSTDGINHWWYKKKHAIATEQQPERNYVCVCICIWRDQPIGRVSKIVKNIKYINIVIASFFFFCRYENRSTHIVYNNSRTSLSGY